ncbi:hypothetical protein EPUL_004314 [Erysiphe pulchra]|uniref:Glutamyl-tRNA amidotransferase complex subunit Gta3 domain-containing protein n=1 Tax=Erysiphe pulchra TaxID=225359 RepID=A0A2S4PQ01_9PEZI|nr:hypothetical protein EPUL_004314 [Erysiphe pulchra]
MAPLQYSRYVFWTSRSLLCYCSKRQIPRFNSRKTIARYSSTKASGFAISISQQQRNNSSNSIGKPDISGKSSESKEEEKKKQQQQQQQQAPNLVDLIDKYEDAILRDLEKSRPKKNATTTTTDEEDLIDRFLCKPPTWSTVSEYGCLQNEAGKEQHGKQKINDSLDSSRPVSISDEEIHRLLRLSALPPVNDAHQLQILREELEAQLAFVRKVQCVDTEGVEPLVCVRDETAEGVRNATITLDDLKTALSKEDQMGKCQRPRKRKTIIVNEETKWDVFANSENVIEMNGEKYFIVKQRKSAPSSEIKEQIET